MTEKHMDNCVFCKIVRGEIPATVVLATSTPSSSWTSAA